GHLRRRRPPRRPAVTVEIRRIAPPLRSGGGGPCEAWWRGHAASRAHSHLPRKRRRIRDAERRAMSRIERRFAQLKQEGRAGLVIYLTAGDPDPDTSFALFSKLAEAGADLIEIGMPFSDPMADGPSIQAAGQRALKSGTTLRSTLAMVRRLREADPDTPCVLMGYYNPIYRYGEIG